MKILVVEDEVLIALHLEMVLTDLGHEVCGMAMSASEAVASASAHRPDVTLMDIRLAQGTSGIDAAREIYERYGLRCIFLSGNLDEKTRLILSAYEPIAFVGKPVLPVLLKQVLEKIANY